jgi:hypothetical protein
MTYRCTVRDGVIHLEQGARLPDGTEVRVEIAAAEPVPSVFQKLARLAGRAKNLPPDLARNHDCYLHGAPRK